MQLGRYEIVREIGTGGMGTVFVGRARGVHGFERVVAIKVMHRHLARDPEFVAMFLDEARLAARILHPNVVATHDVQESQSGLFLVMDYVAGPSLQAILRVLGKTEKRIPLEISLRVFQDVLTGLHAAHEVTDGSGTALDIVHRDVSPENILVGRDGASRLTDFGLARAQAHIGSTRGGHLKGKLAFMAPEQVLYGRVDRMSDIYAAGLSLWETWTGRRAFRGDTDGVILGLVAAGLSESPQLYHPSLPDELAEVCMRAVRAEPDERYPTCARFASELESAARFSGCRVATTLEVADYIKRLIEEEKLVDSIPPASIPPGPILPEMGADPLEPPGPASFPGAVHLSPGRPESPSYESVGRTRARLSMIAALVLGGAMVVGGVVYAATQAGNGNAELGTRGGARLGHRLALPSSPRPAQSVNAHPSSEPPKVAPTSPPRVTRPVRPRPTPRPTTKPFDPGEL